MIDRSGAYWKKAFSISCALHLAAFAAVGAAATERVTNRPTEHFIAIELSAPEAGKAAPAPSLAEDSAFGADFASPPQARATTDRAEKIATERDKDKDKDMPLDGGLEKGANRAQSANVLPQSADGEKNSLMGAESSGLGGETSSTGGAQGGAPGGQVSGARHAGGANRAAEIERFVAAVETQNKRNYPYMALKRNLTGRAVAHVELDAAGNLVSVYIGVSSGIELLDAAAVKAVRAACPFRHGLGTGLAMDVPVSYTLGG